jgi:hypothetical protein
MMTMEPTSAERQEEEAPRCQHSTAGGVRCWREATERPLENCRPWPIYCPEHLRLVELDRKADDQRCALDAMEGWIREKVDSPTESKVEFYAYNMREQAVADYWRAAVAAEAAEIIASQGEDEEPIPQEQAERFAALWLRSEAISKAHGLLADAPEDVFGLEERWAIVAGLRAASESARDEAEACKQEIGFE